MYKFFKNYSFALFMGILPDLLFGYGVDTIQWWIFIVLIILSLIWRDA